MNAYYSPNQKDQGKSVSKWMGALEKVDLFDPLFFNISPKEAESMDPQHRLFLEQAWKAIEDAGYNPQNLSGENWGVFTGISQGDYGHLRDQPKDLDAYFLTGNTYSVLSARIAYLLNLTGPCLSIDTALFIFPGRHRPGLRQSTIRNQ